MEARERRRLNLVISGIDEKANGSVDEVKGHDEKFVKKIMIEIRHPDFSLHYIRRIGKQQPNSLIRVTCPDRESKGAILRSSKKLKSQRQFRGVYINQDLSPLQQRELKQLRDELRRLQASGEDVRIRDGTIVDFENPNFQ